MLTFDFSVMGSFYELCNHVSRNNVTVARSIETKNYALKLNINFEQMQMHMFRLGFDM